MKQGVKIFEAAYDTTGIRKSRIHSNKYGLCKRNGGPMSGIGGEKSSGKPL